jgi:hypothetical protein
MSDDEWCRDTARDEAVRAAEDAAAVPAIQHRDLPEAVAALTERVARLEAVIPKSVSGSNAEVPENKGGTMPAIGLRTERVTLEVTHRCMYPAAEWILEVVQEACSQPGESVRVVDEADAASDEVVAHRATLNALQETREYLAAANRGIARLTAERDAALARVEELAAAAPPRDGLTERESAEPSRTPSRSCEAAVTDGGPDATAGPVAWGVVNELGKRIAVLDDPPSDGWSGCTAVPLYDKPPRVWLTAEEREAVEEAMVDYGSNVGDSDCERMERVLRALLAREMPPKVTVPPVILGALPRVREQQWIAAIRAAGGEVE